MVQLAALVVAKKADFISFEVDATLILSIVNFLIFVILMRIFFFKKIRALLDKRASIIEEQYSKAQEDQKEAEALKNQYDKKLSKAQEEGDEIIAKKVQQSKEQASDIIRQAHDEAQRIKSRAKRDIEREQLKAKDELKKEVSDIVIATTQKILNKQLTVDDHDRLIDESIQKIGENSWQN